MAHRKWPTAFGKKLREAREAAKMTQGALAEAVGMPPQSITKYETGVSEPVWGTVIRFALALGVTPNDFRGENEIAGADPGPKTKPRRKK